MITIGRYNSSIDRRKGGTEIDRSSRPIGWDRRGHISCEEISPLPLPRSNMASTRQYPTSPFWDDGADSRKTYCAIRIWCGALRSLVVLASLIQVWDSNLRECRDERKLQPFRSRAVRQGLDLSRTLIFGFSKLTQLFLTSFKNDARILHLLCDTLGSCVVQISTAFYSMHTLPTTDNVYRIMTYHQNWVCGHPEGILSSHYCQEHCSMSITSNCESTDQCNVSFLSLLPDDLFKPQN